MEFLAHAIPKNQSIAALAIGICLALFPAAASAFVELNAFYYSEAATQATTTSGTRMFIEAAVGFKVDKKGQFLAGWGYATHSHTDTGTTSTTYTSTQMGPRFVWLIDKDRTWGLGFAYYIVTSASYDGGSSAETWKGTAMHLDLGYNLPVSEDFLVGLRLNYSSATFTEKLVGSSNYSEIAYAKTYMYPSVAAIYMF